MPVDTGKVTGRRTLRFDRVEQIVDEVKRLASGPYRQLGNWSLGQICDHLANTVTGSIDGMDFKAPWLIRVMARCMKRRWLSNPMPAGFKLPEKAAKQLISQNAISDAQGVEKLCSALERFHREPQRSSSPVFGPMSDEDWRKLHCRHSELHLSFLQPGA